MTVLEKPPMPGDPGFVSYIPDSAPFSPEQKDWLNGFFAGFLADQATPPALPAAAGSPTGRFARDPGEFAMAGGATQLTLIPGGLAASTPETETTP